MLRNMEAKIMKIFVSRESHMTSHAAMYYRPDQVGERLEVHCGAFRVITAFPSGRKLLKGGGQIV